LSGRTSGGKVPRSANIDTGRFRVP
jgi:hypothetical protein